MDMMMGGDEDFTNCDARCDDEMPELKVYPAPLSVAPEVKDNLPAKQPTLVSKQSANACGKAVDEANKKAVRFASYKRNGNKNGSILIKFPSLVPVRKPRPPTATKKTNTPAANIPAKDAETDNEPHPINAFQHYSPALIKILEDAKFNGDSRVHYFQREAVLATHDMLSREDPTTCTQPILICAPPGAGKTGMIAMLPYIVKAQKVLILTPSIMLSNQVAATLGHFENRKSYFEITGLCGDEKGDNPDLKILGPPDKVLELVRVINGQFDPCIRYPNIMIVNVQKFGGKSGTTLNDKYGNEETKNDVRNQFKKFDLCIVDEAQHYPAETWKTIVDEFFKSRVMGGRKTVIFLTATPVRGDGSPILEKQKNRIAYSVELSQLEGRTIRKLEFAEKRRLNDPDWTSIIAFFTVGDHIDGYLKRQRENEPRFEPQAMIIVNTIEQAKLWAYRLNQIAIEHPERFGGYKEKFAVAIFSDYNCQRLTDDFTLGVYQVAIICNMLKEGYSNPKVTLCVILRNIGSRVLFDQYVGRCMRLNREIEGEPDRSTGVVLSYEDFGQQKMWDGRLKLAVEDPIEE